MASPAVKTWSHSMRNTEMLVDFFKLTSVTWKQPALRSSLGYFWGWIYLEYQLPSIYINTTNQITSSKTNNDLSALLHPGTMVMDRRSQWKTKQDRVEMEEKGKRWGEQDKMGKLYRRGKNEMSTAEICRRRDWGRGHEARIRVQMSRLTCDLQRGITADGFAQVIPRYAHIHPFVGLAAPSVNDSEEEEGAAGEEHTVGPRILPVCFDSLAIFVPLHHGGRPTFCFTVQSGGLTLGNNEVWGVFDNPWRSILQPGPRSYKRESVVTICITCNWQNLV